MNNKQPRENRNMLDTTRTQSQGRWGSTAQGIGQDLDQARADSGRLRGEIEKRYGQSFMPPGLTPSASGFFDTSGFGVGGGVPDYSASKAGYQKFADTGGINRGDFDEAKGSFSNFINTGGIGEGEAQALRARATSGIPAFYDAYKRNASRRRSVQGGYSPGFDAQQAEIGRQAGREAFQASRQVEGDIADKRQQGRMFGTTGSANLAGTINQMEQSGKLAGLGGLKGISDSEGSFGEAAANRKQQLQLALQDMYMKDQGERAQGLQSLYSSAPGAVGQSYNALLNSLQGMDSSNLQNLGLRLNSPGAQDRRWEDAIGPIGNLLMAGGGIATGFGGFGGGSQMGGRLNQLPLRNRIQFPNRLAGGGYASGYQGIIDPQAPGNPTV